MTRKVFVSYKYNDSQVARVPYDGALGTCRDYVDVIMGLIKDVAIYKGEEDDNDLSQFKDSTIRTHLKAKIRDSSVTVVLISKGMKEAGSEKDQWIPWEIKYSLRRKAYGEVRSNSNGMLAVIIPDELGSYDHYFEYSGCAHCNSRTHKLSSLFEILGKNMFNKKVSSTASCTSTTHGSSYHIGNDHSYIHQVTWHEFLKQPEHYIETAIALRDKISDYKIQKLISA